MSPRLPLVLLPGLDGTGRLFAPLLAELPPSLAPQVVRYSPDEALDYAGLLPRVEAQLPRGGAFALLGESFSGPLALELSARRPAGLAAVVLVATFHRRPTAAALAALRPLVRAPAFSLPLPRFLVRALLAGGDADAALVEEMRGALASVRPEVLAARARAALGADASAAARAVQVPALYLLARRDALMRQALAEELRALVPQLEVAAIDAPHLVLQRAPEASAQALAAFLRRAGLLEA